MTQYVTLPDGRRFERRQGESVDDALMAAAQLYPEMFGIEKEQGFFSAAKAGAKEYAAHSLIGTGYTTGNREMEERGRAMAAPDPTPGAYMPTTDADVSAAFDQGIGAGLGAGIRRYITEPVGGMVGRYGAPMLAGAGASAATTAVTGPAAVVAAPVAGALGLMAADAPAQLGANMLAADRYATEQYMKGQDIPTVQNADLYTGALAQAALMPLFSKLGGAATHRMFKLMGPDIAATAKAVQRGDMTKEAAVASLNTTAKNYLVKTGEMAVVGPAMMVGTEAIRTGVSGEDIDSPEAIARMKEGIHEGLVSAPLFGLPGAFGRTGQVRAINKAGEKWDVTDAQIKAAGGTLAEVRAAEQKAEAARAAGGPTMDLSIMPQYAKDFTGPVDPNARAQSLDSLTPAQPKYPTHGAPFAGVKDGVITDAMFNALGVGNGKKMSALDAELRSFVGQPIAPVAARMRELLMRQQELAGGKGASAWANREGAVDRIQRTLDNLPREEAPMRVDPTISAPVTRQMDMFDQAGTPMPDSGLTPARMEGIRQTEQQVAAQRRNDVTIRDTIQFDDVRKQNTQSDMFDPAATAPKVRIPEPTIADTAIEYAKREAELRSQYEVAREAGDHAAAARILDVAEVELGAMAKVIRDRESTQDMFTEQGRPTEAATRHEGATHDMFDPSFTRRPPERATPAEAPKTTEAYNDRNAALFAEYERARDSGDHARMIELIQMGKEELPQFISGLDRASTKPMFDAKGTPKPEALAHERANEARAAAEAKEIADNRAANAAVRGAREAEAPNITDALKRGSDYASLLASDKEKVLEAKARVAAGAAEKVDALATGLGRAAKAETLQELTPTHTKLPADRVTANLWWNDLAHISKWNRNVRGTTPEQHQLARDAILHNSTLTARNKTFTEAQLANAESKNKNITATARRSEQKAAEKALREAETSAAVNKEQLKAEDKATREAAEDVIRQQDVAADKAAKLSESAKEEQRRSAEEAVDPEVVAAERETRRAAKLHKKIPPKATMMVETVDANGKVKEVEVNAREQVRTALEDLDAMRDFMANCLGVS